MKYRAMRYSAPHAKFTNKHAKITNSMIILFRLLPLRGMQACKNAIIEIRTQELNFIFKGHFIQGALYLSF